MGRLAGALGGLSGDDRRQFSAGLFQLRFDLGALGRIGVADLGAQFFDLDFSLFRQSSRLASDSA